MTQKMPVLFLGHGNPMNAILDTPFTRALTNLGSKLPTPRAILCVSAHWLTEGTWVTHMTAPRTIHDFFGFPKELFDVLYPAPGSPEIASLIRETVIDPMLQLDDETWGLDHGTWSVLKHLYPQAKIPVIQLSIDRTQDFSYHVALAKKLRALRTQGIMIVGSGNIVHNLREIKWGHDAQPYDWAIEYDAWVKQKLLQKDDRALVEHATKTTAGKLSVPTTEHYIPLLYALGAAEADESPYFEYEGIENASISMRCLSYGFR